MTAAIDTGVMLDILLNDEKHYTASKTLLEEHSPLIISPLVYSELLAQFIRKFGKPADFELNNCLKELGITVVNFSLQDMVVCAEAWQEFSKKQQEIACRKCGHVHTFSCKKCNHELSWRNHIQTDFLIGSHAQNHADILLARDKGFYKKYFKVRVIC